MNKLLKIVGLAIAAIAFLIICAVSFIKLGLPNIEAPDITIEATPERLARGEYLANNVMGCLDCHAQRDFSKFTAPTITETKGRGGEEWNRAMGFPGHMVAPNITPYKLKDWTDGEIYRAITSGVSKDGSPLFPIMPYKMYGQLEKEDIYSVIAYIKTLPAIPSETPERELDFPLNLIVNTMPSEPTHQLKAHNENAVENGKYVITSAACFDCHTPQDKGQFIESMAYAGGMEFPLMTGGIVRSANITPDAESGIGNWTKEQFVNRFKQHADSSFVAYDINQGDFNTFMPWTYYAGMKTEDLESIYDYLKSLQPIAHKVEKFSSNATIAKQ